VTDSNQIAFSLMLELAVLSEGVVAFCAAQELGWGFISASCLHLPDVSGVVSAFWAFDPNGGKCSQFLFFFAYNGDKLLRIMLDYLADFGFNFLGWFLLFVSAFWTHKHQRRLLAFLRFLKFKARTTFRAELHMRYSVIRLRITLLGLF
jgi:hypothetical protein